MSVSDKLGWILHWTVAGGLQTGGPHRQLRIGAGIEARTDILHLLAQLLYQAPLGCGAEAGAGCSPALVLVGALRVPWDVYGHDSLMSGVTRGAKEAAGVFVAATLGVGYDADVREKYGDGIAATERRWIAARERLRRWQGTFFTDDPAPDGGARTDPLTGWLAWQRAQAQSGLPPRLWQDAPASTWAPSDGWLRSVQVQRALLTPRAAASVVPESGPVPRLAAGRRRDPHPPRLPLAGLIGVPDEDGMPLLVPMSPSEQETELDRLLDVLGEQGAQARARREQSQRLADASRPLPLPDMGQVVANTLIETPLALIGPFLMWDEESARNVVSVTRRVRVFKYGSEEQEAGEGMQLGLSALAGLGPGLALGAERVAGLAGAGAAVRATEQRAAQAAVRLEATAALSRELALAQELETAQRAEAQSARSLLARLARKPADWLASFPYRVELRGLGSSFGNVKIRRTGGQVRRVADEIQRLDPAPAPPAPPSRSAERAVRSLERRRAEHVAKLERYKQDPASFDNQGHLENAPSPEIRARIIQSRIRHLEHEIETFEKEILRLQRLEGAEGASGERPDP